MAPTRRGRKPPLEVRSHEDGAWYDADVSNDGSRLRVHFNGFGSEDDEFWEGNCLESTTSIMEIMRLRSKQLQDSECTNVSIGTIVCANFKTPDGSESKYYDAKVLQIHQSPHSFLKGKRELCKCQFKLVWEDGPLKSKEVFLGCADISLIDTESVEKHPVACVVLQAARDYVEQSETDLVTEELEQSLASEDIEVSCADILSDDPPSKVTSWDFEGLPDDFMQKVKIYDIFDEFLGKEADKLEEALVRYNARNKS